jgi:flagellar motor component MotA
MNRDEFVKKYYDIVRRAMEFSEKARREGLLALEGMFDHKKINDRDIFEYGIRFVIDGTDQGFIDKLLSNIISQEKDENTRTLKTIQKEAVLRIQSGENPRTLYYLLNSYTDISLREDELKEAYGIW